MAFTYIATANDGATDPGSYTQMACTTPLNILAGDLIILWACYEDGTAGAISCNDGGSNTLTMTAESSYNGTCFGAFGYKLSASANASATFTFYLTNSRPYIRIQVMQFRPDASETVTLDPLTSNPSWGSGNGTSVTSGAITTIGTDTIVLAGIKNYTLGTTISSPQIGGSVATVLNDGGYSNVLYRILTSGMTAGTATGTISATSDWLSGLIGFKSSASPTNKYPTPVFYPT